MTKAKTASKTKSLAVADDSKPAKIHSGLPGVLRYTAEQIQDKCQSYLTTCDTTDRKPTWQGLAGYLDVTSETLTIWLQDKNANESLQTKQVSAVLKKVADSLSDRLQQRTDCMAMISVKQPLYGGFVDRPDMGAGGAVTVNFSFVTSDGKITAGLTK